MLEQRCDEIAEERLSMRRGAAERAVLHVSASHYEGKLVLWEDKGEENGVRCGSRCTTPKSLDG